MQDRQLKFLNFFLLLSLFSPDVSKTKNCGSLNNADGTLNTVVELKSVSDKYVSNNIATFCVESLRENFRKSKEFPDSVNTDDELFDSAIKRGMDSWAMSMYPSMRMRTSTLAANKQLSELSIRSLDSADDYLRADHSAGPSTVSDEMATISIKNLEDSKAESVANLRAVGTNLSLQGACIQLMIGGCAPALKQAIEIAAPVANGTIAYPSLYSEILGDGKYTAGLKVAALTLIRKVRNRDATGDYFSDVKDGFLKAGISTPDAEKMAWKVMGLIATGGPNISERVFSIKTPKSSEETKVSLSVLASLAPALDLISGRKGHLYSYPQDVSTTCDTGKSYHFWLTAYLARDLALNGNSPMSASAAAFSAQKGYQMLSETGGRDPLKSVMEDGFSAYDNTLRMDLAASSAGAIYGALSMQSVGHASINIDQGLEHILHDSQPLVPIKSGEDARTLEKEKRGAFFFRWKSIFAPDSAYFLYRDSINCPIRQNLAVDLRSRW